MNKFSILALITLVLGCRADGQESQRLPHKDEQLRTSCLGRYQFSLPSNFVAASVANGSFRPAERSVDDPFEVVVRAAGLTSAEFDLEVKKRREELKGKSDDTVDVFRLERRFSDQATLFRIQQIDDAYRSELDLLRGSSFVTVTVDSYHNKFEVAEKDLVKFGAGIKETSSDGSRPQGFCLGPLTILGDFKEETGSFLFRDGKGDDFRVEMSTYVGDKDVPLLSRVSSPDSLLTKFKIHHKVLRAKERSVAGMRAQEWLAWAKLDEQGDQKTFGFALETMPKTSVRNNQNITLSFDTGQPLEDGTKTKNWMSDEEAVKFWDTVVGSIRSF
jgi:hypothetical protein